jgi:hypothetical protein
MYIYIRRLRYFLRISKIVLLIVKERERETVEGENLNIGIINNGLMPVTGLASKVVRMDKHKRYT